MDIATLKAKVLCRVDESITDIAGGASAKYNVEEFLTDACKTIVAIAPPHLLSLGNITIAPTKNEDGSGYVALPADFERIVEFKMKGWQRVATIIQTSDPIYKNQFNKYTRGGIAKPIAVLTKDGETKKLEYFSLPDNLNHAIEKATYVKTCLPNQLDDRLAEGLCWLAASMILTVTNEKEQGEYCNIKFKETLETLM